MSEELEDYGDQLTTLSKEIESGIRQVKKLAGKQRSSKVVLVQNRIKRAKNVLRSYKIEINSLTKESSFEFQEKARQYEIFLNEQLNELNWAKQEGEREELMEDKTNKKVLDQTEEIIEDDIARLKRTRATAVEMTEIGGETLVQMADQTDKLMGVQDTIESMNQVTLKIARKKVTEFARRQATDKICIVLICLILCSVIFAIVYGILDPDSSVGENIPDNIKPDLGSVDINLPEVDV